MVDRVEEQVQALQRHEEQGPRFCTDQDQERQQSRVTGNAKC